MAGSKIAFDLVSPEKLLLSVEADMVTVPGTGRLYGRDGGPFAPGLDPCAPA